MHVLTCSLLALVALAAPEDPAAPPAPPEYAGPPQALHAVTNRAFTGIPSLAVSPGGRLWATWYAGVTPGEDHNNYVVLSTSGDDGKTWKEVLVVDPDAEGPRRTFDPELWLGPDGKVRWFWADRAGGNSRTDALWMIELAEPDSETTAWARPRCVARGVMMCKPLVLSSGEWVLPVCTWFTEQSSKMVVSTDQGRTWSIRGGATMPKEHRLFDEHMFIERKDGAIWVLSRTKYGIGESVSSDRGKTWPDLTPSALRHPSARFFIRRLNSGNLLLVKHGPIDKRTDRSLLTAYVSADEGKTWTGGLMLDERKGVSYPDGQQTADGLIRIIYDYNRTSDRQILLATFREEDVAAGKIVSKSARLRQVVSAGSGGRERAKTANVKPAAVEANQDGQPMRKDPPGSLAADGAEAETFASEALLFTDRKYTVSECPPALAGCRFLRIKLDGKKTLRCSRAGVVYFLTPVPARNRDSCTQMLLDQGFQKVQVPEVRLFDPANSHNFCTLYQKACKEGETVAIGKWAVPLFRP